VTPEDVRKLSRQIERLVEDARLLRCQISIHAIHPQEESEPQLISRINSLLKVANKIARQDSKLFVFECGYRANQDEVKLLDDTHLSYHHRALHDAYGFLMRLLTHEADKLSAPDYLLYRAPKHLTKLDLELAEAISKEYRDVLQADDLMAMLAIEAEQAANLLVHTSTRIPPENRTRVLSKKEAAGYLGRPNEDSGVRWLNRCIADGTIRCEELSRQGFVFNILAFPEPVRPLIRRE
jgi:hypothetical protein